MLLSINNWLPSSSGARCWEPIFKNSFHASFIIYERTRDTKRVQHSFILGWWKKSNFQYPSKQALEHFLRSHQCKWVFSSLPFFIFWKIFFKFSDAQFDWSAWLPFLTFHPSVPKKNQALGFEVPKFWHSISSDAELLDDELEEEVEETTTHHEPYPFFEEEQTPVNETTQLGNDVHLHCRVQNLGEKTVSEIEQKIYFPHHLTIDFTVWQYEFSFRFVFCSTRFHGCDAKVINCT